MTTRCQELIKIGDALFTKRYPLLTLWQTFAENFDPIHADFTRARYMSEEFASYLMSGRPVLAHRELSNAISSILRPRNMPWHKAKTGNETINKDPAAAAWLEMTDTVMGGIFNDRRSQFGRATKEGDAFYTLTGQCVIEPEVNALRNGMIYRCWHLRDCVWTESAELEIDSFHRKWKPTARQLLAYGKKQNWQLHPDVAKKAEKDPNCEIECRVVIMPSEEYDSLMSDANGAKPKRSAVLRFVRIVIDVEHFHVMEETYRRKLGVVIPRWVTLGGFSQYAYAPTSIIALPDGRMLQQMTLMLLEIGSKILDPPMKAVGDAIQGGVNLMAGSITWVDPDYDERTGEALTPIEFHPEGLQWGLEREQKIEQVISEAFYLNVLNLPEYDKGDAKTATEWSMRMKEYIRRATPLFDPMDTEYNGAICDDTFDTLLHNGAFGSPLDMPPALRGASVEFKFRNPLVQAEEEQTTLNFRNLLGLLGEAQSFDSSLAVDVDTDVGFRDAVPGTGARPAWLRAKDLADQMKAANRAKQEQIQQTEMMGHLGENAGKVAAALKTGGEAAQAMQGAPV